VGGRFYEASLTEKDVNTMFQTLLLLAEGEAAAPQGNPLQGILPIMLIMVVGYFLLLRPARQQEKQRQTLIAALKKNDDVVTNAGIIGTVVNLKPNKDEVVIESGNSRLRILKSSIAQVLNKSDQKEDENESDETGTSTANDRAQKKD
jgi:preprotein translocase subunit YajC